MKIRLIDFTPSSARMNGFEPTPKRQHESDAGADVFARQNYTLRPGETYPMPLGFGLELPDGLSGYIFPRSSLSKKGIVCELPPIDSGYRGEVHAIVTNMSSAEYKIRQGDRIGQLVIMPIILADFVSEFSENRGSGAFGSTGR